MEVGNLLNHTNSCVLCVCLLFNFHLFIVINLSPGVLSAQHLLNNFGELNITDNPFWLEPSKPSTS